MVEHTAKSNYADGQRDQASRLFGEAAERDLENGRMASAMENKRWLGNSLMWDGRHDEALAVLLEVASCSHPEVDPVSIYTAKTDCIMLSLYHSSANAIQQLIDSTHDYLERIGRTYWRHRLDLLKTMLQCRQGRFEEAIQTAQQARRLARAIPDGPHYSEFAYLKWLARPAFRLQNLQQIEVCLDEACNTPTILSSDNIRLSCMRLLGLRTRFMTQEVTQFLSTAALASLPHISGEKNLWEEFYDVARALLVVGELEAVRQLPARKPDLLPFESASLQTDLEINLLRKKLGLPPWDAEVNRPSKLEGNYNNTQHIEHDFQPLVHSLIKLDELAAREDKRLETRYYSSAVEFRREHTAKLMGLLKNPPPNPFTNTV